jgi:hypothetical protein
MIHQDTSFLSTGSSPGSHHNKMNVVCMPTQERGHESYLLRNPALVNAFLLHTLASSFLVPRGSVGTLFPIVKHSHRTPVKCHKNAFSSRLPGARILEMLRPPDGSQIAYHSIPKPMGG